MSATPAHITVAGNVNDASYQEAKEIARRLASSHSNVSHECLPLFETDWEEYAKKQSKRFDVEHKASPMVYYNGKNYVGSLKEFLAWARAVYHFDSPPSRMMSVKRASREFRAMMDAREHPFCYLDISVGGDIPRRVVFELFESVCPKTSQNFIDLCTGAHGPSYAGSPFHRVVPGGWVQGGDIDSGSGTGGSSAKGGTFADECFAIKHSRAGTLSMANSSCPHSNASQFFVTLSPLEWLDYKFVAFGRVISGLRVFRKIEKQQLSNERPVNPCVIVGSGIFTGEERHAASYPEFEGKFNEEASENIDDVPSLPEDHREKEERGRFRDVRGEQDKLLSLSDTWLALSKSSKTTRGAISSSVDIIKRFLPNHAAELAHVFDLWVQHSFDAEVTKSQFVSVGMQRVLVRPGGRTFNKK